jgi:hypothetical protein
MKIVLIILLIFLVGCVSIPKFEKQEILNPSKGIKISFDGGSPPKEAISGRPFNINIRLDNYFPDDVDVRLSLSQNNDDVSGLDVIGDNVLMPAAKYNEKGQFRGSSTEVASFPGIILSALDNSEDVDLLVVARYDVDSRIINQICIEDTSVNKEQRCNYKHKSASDSYKYAPIVLEFGDMALSGYGGSVDVSFDKISILNKGGGIVSTGSDEEVYVDFNVIVGSPFSLECLQKSKFTSQRMPVKIPGRIILEKGDAILENCVGTVNLNDPFAKEDFLIESAISHSYKIEARKRIKLYR